MEDKRLDRIEAKLDELTKVVTDLARVEERMTTLFKRMDRQDEQNHSLDLRLGEIEKITVGRGAVYQIVERLIWIVAGAGVAWLFSKGMIK